MKWILGHSLPWPDGWRPRSRSHPTALLCVHPGLDTVIHNVRLIITIDLFAIMLLE